MSMKTTCLGLVVIYVLVGLGFASWFFLRFPAFPGGWLPETSFRLEVALGGGYLAALPVLFALSMLQSTWLRLQERAGLTRAAEGGLPVDGDRGVFYGPIHRHGAPLTAPLSGRDCLLYRYEITHSEESKKPPFGSSSMSQDSDRSRPSTTVVDAQGFALTPSTIQTAGGPVKLLTLVKPEFNADLLSFDETAENYRTYLTTATLKGQGSLDVHPSLLRSLQTNTGGAIRYDLGTGKLDSSKEPFQIREHIVQHGDNVVVFGRYSAACGGIVHDPDSMWDTRLRKGSLESLRRGLAMGAFGKLVQAVLWCAVAVAVAWAFFRFGPTHIWD